MEQITINDVENNVFPVLKKIKWRNNKPEFNDVSSLIKSLEVIAGQSYLERSLDGFDVSTLKLLNLNNPERLKELKGDDVKLLWKACQIPDFRKISNQDHADLIIQIFDFVRKEGIIPSDWLNRDCSPR